MRRTIAGVTLTLLLAPGMASPVGAQEASLAQCQALKDRIDRYTALRRHGGTASQMEGWKKQLRRAEATFREKECRAYRRELQ
jgi:hypothetical protein